MDLIARYLQAVKFWLPKKQQDDIIAELSEDLSAQIEERESTLARKLNESEIETLLRQRGSPIMVANRFLPQQSLIGPLLFPIYVFVMKLVTLVSLIPAIVGLIAGIISRALGHVVGTGLDAALRRHCQSLLERLVFLAHHRHHRFRRPRAYARQKPAL